MDCALKIAPSPICSSPIISPSSYLLYRYSLFLPRISSENPKNSCFSRTSSSPQAVPCAVEDVQRISGLESLFCYDKPIPEEIIEKPVGLSLAEKNVGDNPHCPSCQAKGSLLCTTCSGSGLYVDSILESQRIIVKVRCLGCGGTGNTMCTECGGRGHV